MSKTFRAKVPLIIVILLAALISGLVSTAVWELAVNSEFAGGKGCHRRNG